MSLRIVRTDITTLQVDTFVNLSDVQYVLTEGLGAEILRSYYQKWFMHAWEKGCKSFAIPFIPAKNSEYPKEEGMRIALGTGRKVYNGGTET